MPVPTTAGAVPNAGAGAGTLPNNPGAAGAGDDVLPNRPALVPGAGADDPKENPLAAGAGAGDPNENPVAGVGATAAAVLNVVVAPQVTMVIVGCCFGGAHCC